MANARTRRATMALAGVAVVGLGAAAPPAMAHAHVSPSVVQRGHSETFTLVVPTEGQATTSAVELTVPGGFQLGSFEAAPGWKRSVRQTGSGDEAIVSKVAWAGGSVPGGEAAYLRFQGVADRSGPYAFKVRQTYSDGRVVEWTGSEGSDTPAPVVSVVDTITGDDGKSSTATIALVVAILALLVAIGALALRSGRPLT